MMKKSAIYIRVSTHHQIDKDSLPLQKQDLVNYSKFVLGIGNYEIFEDAGLSAKNTDRPAFQDMMARVRKNEFTHVLVWKIDRISRNLLDFCDMYNEFKKCNVNFISKNEQFDTSSAMGEAMLKIILVFAELERKLTAERVKATMLARAEEGKWNGAPIPLGYKWDAELKFPVIDDNEKKTVELIFNTYLKEKSTSAVRELLNTNHIKTKRDGRWTTKTISDIIRNPFYKGNYRYNYRHTGHGKIKNESEWIVIEDNHEGIISKELWQKCNDIADLNYAKATAAGFRQNARTHIFALLLKCGECGENLYSKQDKKNLDGFIPSIYVCSGKYNNFICNQKTISCNYIGTFVLQLIKNILSTNKNINIVDFEKSIISGIKGVIGLANIEEVYNAFNNSSSSLFTHNVEKSNVNIMDIDNITKEKNKYLRALERLEDLYLFDDEAMSEKDYIIKKNKIQDKLKELNGKLKLQNKNDDNNINMNFLIKANLFALKSFLNETTINYKEIIIAIGRDRMKEFMNTIIDNIVIKDRKIISITFKNNLKTEFIYEK